MNGFLHFLLIFRGLEFVLFLAKKRQKQYYTTYNTIISEEDLKKGVYVMGILWVRCGYVMVLSA